MLERVLGERYEIEEKIGSGGMAEVYRAHDKLLDRPVAVKILHEAYRSDAEFIEKFHREAKAAARLSHPNIVNIYDVGVDNGDQFIVMEYVQGNSLKDKIRENGPLDILTATKIAKDIACGLAHAHANNLVHCDIKPHNILMMPDGHAKIADFGIARAVTESTMTYGGSVIGSVHYFSPEQAQGGTITPKSDVYSLGIVIYEMLTNRLPFTGENAVAIAMKHVEEDPAPPSSFRPQIPPMLEAVVLRAMNKNPDLRLSSFDMIQALSNIEANLSLTHLDDPDATQILPRAKAAKLPPRRNIRQSVAEAKPRPAEKSFIKSRAFIFGLIFFLIFGFGAGILMAFGKVLDEDLIAVPNVAGKQLSLARQILEDDKLRVNVAEIYDSNTPAGQVVSQDPIAGRSVKSERLVTIYVSKGGEAIDMPDLVGLIKSSATDRIKKLGLQLGAIYEKDSESEPGTILSQDPITGTKINRGQVIDLVVSRGYTQPVVAQNIPVKTAPTPPVAVKKIEKTYVPDVHSASLDVARFGVETRGLNVGSVTYRDSKQADGTIISQDPLPDAYVEVGTAVDLVVARNDDAFDDEPISAPSRENTGIKRQ